MYRFHGISDASPQFDYHGDKYSGGGYGQVVIVERSQQIIGIGEKCQQSTCIITFANQKGGVGKTTLCALFASYLVSRGHSVTVFDTDPQQSIVKKRTADTATYAGVPLPYNVYPFSMSNEPALIALIENLHNSAAVDFALFDSAGSLNDQALLALFANTDYLLTPFHYDNLTVPSTDRNCRLVFEQNYHGPIAKPEIPNSFHHRIMRYCVEMAI